MRTYLPFRICLVTALVLLCAAAPAFARGAGQGGGQRAARPPAVRPNRSAPPRAAGGSGPNARPAENQQHLQQWMDSHSNLSLQEQQRALQNMPGFRELTPQAQQHELNELGRLYSMNPQQRSRMLDRNEMLERMTPAQRQQYRGAVQGLASMPLDRQRVMAHAILNLRDFPPEQRQQVIDSPAYRSQFSEGERTMMSTLLMVEPYHQPGAPAPAP